MSHSFQTDIEKILLILAHWRPHLLTERLRCMGEREPRSWACQPASRDSALISASSDSLLTRLLCYKRPPDEKPASCRASFYVNESLWIPSTSAMISTVHTWNHGKKAANNQPYPLNGNERFRIRPDLTRAAWNVSRYLQGFSTRQSTTQSDQSPEQNSGCTAYLS